MNINYVIYLIPFRCIIDIDKGDPTPLMTEGGYPMASRTSYKKDEYGVLVETVPSIKRHISDKFGFKLNSILLMEASFEPWVDFRGQRYSFCDQVDFQVCGIGYSTCCAFGDLVRNAAFDD